MGGGVDLRVVSYGRRSVAVGAGILATFFGWRTVAQVGVLPVAGIAPWLGLTLLLGLLAIWCVVGDEVWHLERNRLDHRVGTRAWGVSRRYQNADLQIVCRFTTKFGRPYFRLYAIADERPHFLAQRDEADLHQLAAFIAFHTGWRIRSDVVPLI
jgi:hypothetical protein